MKARSWLTNFSTGEFSVEVQTHSLLSHKTHQPFPDDALESNFLSGMTAKNQTTERNGEERKLKTKFKKDYFLLSTLYQITNLWPIFQTRITIVFLKLALAPATFYVRGGRMLRVKEEKIV